MKKAILASLLVSSIVVGCEKEEGSKETASNTVKVQNEDKTIETKKAESSSKDQQNNSTESHSSSSKETSTHGDSYEYMEKNVQKLSGDIKSKRLKAASSSPTLAINNEGVVEVLGIALMDSKEEVEAKWGKENFINKIIINQQQKDRYTYTFPVKNNKDNIAYYSVNVTYEESADFEFAVFEMVITVYYDKKAKPTYRIPDEYWKNFTGKSYTSSHVPDIRFITEDQQQLVDIVPVDTNVYKVTAAFENTSSGKNDMNMYDEVSDRTKVEQYMNQFNKNK
ncbi:TPA: hypothetical protein QCU60_005111 [Bacillus cereus]|nr:hypothetical protein [Bacillus cereus]